jgi:hypothetical protein
VIVHLYRNGSKRTLCGRPRDAHALLAALPKRQICKTCVRRYQRAFKRQGSNNAD